MVDYGGHGVDLAMMGILKLHTIEYHLRYRQNTTLPRVVCWPSSISPCCDVSFCNFFELLFYYI